MTDPNPFRTYLDSIRAKVRTGVAREQSHRGALERLLQDGGYYRLTGPGFELARQLSKSKNSI